MGWKSPPADSSKLWLNPSLELQILLACGWSCQSCNVYSQFHNITWVKKGTMTVAQIRHFIGEMHAANAYFGRIRIMGGEPTGHPKLHEIVQLLHDELVLKGHVGHLELITNGDAPEKLAAIRHLIHKVKRSGERAKQKNHVASMRVTPRLLGYEGKRCGQPEFCGWSLGYYGFAPCSSGSGIIKLRNLMDMHQRTSLPTMRGTEKNWPELQQICNDCFHALRDEDKVMSGTGMQPGQYKLNVPHPDVWEHLAPWLHGKSAPWPVYGQQERTAPDGAELPQVPAAV